MHLRKFVLVALIASATAQITNESEADEMKGQTLDISGRSVAHTLKSSLYTATGCARAFIEGEKAAIEADEIRYNSSTETMNARGHVHLLRNDKLTTSDEFKFKVRSRDYLITEPVRSDITRPLTTKLSITDISVDVQKHREDNPEI